jgi:hypothetical protein
MIAFIAVMVSICSGSGTRGTKKEIRKLQEQIERLEKKVDRLAPAPKPPAR